jgi:hypothetical protein
MDGLAAEAADRDPGRFRTVLAGSTGVGGLYDLWGRIGGIFRGRRFDPAYGGIMRER